MVTTKHQRQLAKGVFVNTIGIFAKLSRVLFLIVFSRLLGTKLFGLYMLTWAIQEIVSKICIFGLDRGVMRMLGVIRGTEHERESREITEKVLLLGVGFSICIASCFFLFAPWVSKNLLNLPELSTPLRLFCFGMPAVTGTFILVGSFRNTLNMSYEVIVQSTFEPILVLIFGTTAILLKFGVSGLAVSHVIAAYLTFGLGFYFFRKIYPSSGKSLFQVHVSWPVIFKTSFPMGGMDFLNMFKQRLDLLVIGRLLPLNLVGIYGAVVEIASAVRKTRSAFEPILMPLFQQLHQGGNHTELQNSFALAVRWVLLPALALFGAILIAPKVFLVFFGKDFLIAEFALMIVAFGQVFHVSYGMMEAALSMTGYAYVTLVNSIVLVVINFFLLILMIPKWGLIGAATATAISFVVVTFWRLYQGHKLLGIFPWNRSHLKPLTAFLISLVVVGSIFRLLGVQSMAGATIAAILFVFLYGLLLIMVWPEASDVELAKKAWQRIKDLANKE